MKIFEFAMELELDGKKYYENLIGKTDNEGLKNIFQMLAKDEEKHYKIIENLKKGNKNDLKSETLKKANNIFANMLSSQDMYSEELSQIEAYRHACDLEQKSINIYNKELEKAEDEDKKEVLEMLVQEEKKHKLILENIIEFVSKPMENRAVKTKNSDPEFARWDKTDLE